MKRFASLFLLFAVAQSTQAADSSLKDDMSAIGKLVKAITLASSDSSRNSASAAQAKQLVALFTATQSITPDTLAQMPQDQQAAALADYKSLLQREIDAAGELENAFLNNNNASAAAILQEMQKTKSDGHKKYKPDN
jgi:hypothetical protein